MSYLRGEHYTWVGNGCPQDCPNRPQESNDVYSCIEHDYIWINGLVMPLHVFDLIVAMRYAEMIEEGLVERTEQEAVEKGGLGSWALKRKFGRNPEQELHDHLRRTFRSFK